MPIEEDVRERLLLNARERARSLGSGALEPGDLFVLGATAAASLWLARLVSRADDDGG